MDEPTQFTLQRELPLVERVAVVATLAEQPHQATDLMTPDPVTLVSDTPLVEVLDRLLESEKRRVVVIDGAQQVVGIITDGDILRRAVKRAQPGVLRTLALWFGGGLRSKGIDVAAQGRTAADVMSSPVITVPLDAPITAAIHLMMTHKIKRIPVVDNDGHLVGLVGRAGVLAALSTHRDAP